MTAYYNEFDPKAAEWLRALIKAGHIAPGDVDDRSIKEVTADDLQGYTQIHWFAGIGGWSYALRLAGWPDDAPVWTGSCPCQPFSAAGKKRGADDERHLWPEMRRLIAESGPAVVFGEQVASKDGRQWLAGVRADLETLGYGVGAADLCAAGVGAPHIRQRLFWVSDAGDAERRWWNQPEGEHGAPLHSTDRCGVVGMADAETSERLRDDGAHDGGRRPSQVGGSGSSCWLPDAECSPGSAERIDDARERTPGETGNRAVVAESGDRYIGMAYTDGQRLVEHCQRDGEQEQREQQTSLGHDPSGFGAFRGMGDASRGGFAVGWNAPFAWSSGHDIGASRPGFEVVVCRDGKARRVAPGVPLLAYGIPGRVAQLRGLGNAIVPQVAAEFITAYLEARGDLA